MNKSKKQLVAENAQLRKSQKGQAAPGQPRKGGGQNRGRNRGRGPGQAARRHAVIEYVNPFSPKLYKVPDEFSGKSTSYRLRQQITLTPDATYGTAAIVIAPRVVSALYAAPTVDAAGSVSTWGSASNWADYTSLNTSFDRFRIVSWGFKASCTAPATAAQGLLSILTQTHGSIVTGLTTTSAGAAFRRDLFPVNQNLDVTWVSEPLHNRSREFYSMDDSSASAGANWTYPVVWLVGAASSPVVLDVVMTLELLGEAGTITERMATDAAPQDDGFMSMVRQVYSGMGSAYNTFAQDVREGGYLEAAGARAFNAAASAALGYAGRQVNMNRLTYPGYR